MKGTTPWGSAGISVAPDVRDILDRGLPWHREAACRDTPQVTFFPDETSDPPRMAARIGAGAFLEPLLACQECPVRRPCLEAGFVKTPIYYTQTHAENDRYAERETETVSWVASEGVWGGSLKYEREAVRHFPIPAAVDLLEASFDVRLAARTSAWRERVAGSRVRTRRTRRTRRIQAALDARGGVTAIKSRRAATCEHCRGPLSWARRSDARWCGSACRQAAYRQRIGEGVA